MTDAAIYDIASGRRIQRFAVTRITTVEVEATSSDEAEAIGLDCIEVGAGSDQYDVSVV